MSADVQIQAANINDLKRFSPEARVNQLVLRSKDIVTRMNCYEPGQVTPMHIHPDDDEVILCLEGRGAVTFEDREEVPLQPGCIANVPAGLLHGLKAAPDNRMVLLYWAKADYTSIRPNPEPGMANVRLPGEEPR